MPSQTPPRPSPTQTRARVTRVVGTMLVAGLAVGGAVLIQRAPQTMGPSAMAVPAVPVASPDASGSSSPSAAWPGRVASTPTPTPSSSAGTALSPGGAASTTPTAEAAGTVEEVAPTPSPTETEQAGAAVSDGVDATWVRATSTATGIPERALRAYAAADLTLDREAPGCYFGWNTVAAIGSIESRHGSFGGATLGADGIPRPSIIGIPLNGVGVARISDSDGGRLDGDATWDRAVGPLQFIPTTWARWASDGNGDGVRNPQQIDDAALAAGRYLCTTNPMNTAEGWRSAVLSYNNSSAYVTNVAETANRYALAVLSE